MQLRSVFGFAGVTLLLSLALGCGSAGSEGDPSDTEGALQSDPTKPHYELVQQRIYQNYKSTADSSKTGYDAWDIVLVRDTETSKEYFVAQAFKTEPDKRTPVFELVIQDDEKHTSVLRDPNGQILPNGLDRDRAEGLLLDFKQLNDFIEGTPSCTEAWIQAAVASILLLPATALAAGCFFYGGPAACVLAIQLPLVIAGWDYNSVRTIMNCNPKP